MLYLDEDENFSSSVNYSIFNHLKHNDMPNEQKDVVNIEKILDQNKTKWGQFGTLVSVFFFWGFVAASNDILIPVFKEKLNLQQWQSQMISFAFYVAYTIGSLIYFAISKASGGDILNRLGYKNGIAIGLVISA